MLSEDGQISLTEGQKILVLQKEDKQAAEFVELAGRQVGSSGHVEFATLESISKMEPSSFDVAYFISPIELNKVDFGSILCALRPKGILHFRYLVLSPSKSFDQVQSTLKLNGFIQVTVVNSTPESIERLKESHTELIESGALLCQLQASKPAYEIGDSVPLKLASKTEAVKTWTLSANDMFDDDVIDSDAILDDVDLKKPDPATLKATCGAGPAKRKACKNCTCGLAEELEAESVKVDTAAAKSSCGSCYLGDAFRCSSCPYRGMPAFKPGEKIALPAGTMQDDL